MAATVSGDLDLARQRVLSIGGMQLVAAGGPPAAGNNFHPGDLWSDYTNKHLWQYGASGWVQLI